MERRKVKNGEKSPWGQCLRRPVPNGRRRPGFSHRSLLFFVPYKFFCPFRLSLVPTICPWVSEDGVTWVTSMTRVNWVTTVTWVTLVTKVTSVTWVTRVT